MNGDPATRGRIRFVDEGGVLGPAVRERLAEVVACFPAGVGPVEVVVQIVDTVPGRCFRDHAIAARRDHATDAARSLALVLARQDRHVELATAPCWAEVFTPPASAALLAMNFVPAMRAGDLPRALAATLAAIGGQLERADASPPARSRWVRIGIPVAAALITLAGFGFVQAREHLCRQCRSWGEVSSVVLAEPTYQQEGRREIRFHCPKCDAEYREVRAIPVRSNDTGSDTGSGAGGGDDGGGGADW